MTLFNLTKNDFQSKTVFAWGGTSLSRSLGYLYIVVTEDREN